MTSRFRLLPAVQAAALVLLSACVEQVPSAVPAAPGGAAPSGPEPTKEKEPPQVVPLAGEWLMDMQRFAESTTKIQRERIKAEGSDPEQVRKFLADQESNWTFRSDHTYSNTDRFAHQVTTYRGTWELVGKRVTLRRSDSPKDWDMRGEYTGGLLLLRDRDGVEMTLYRKQK